jgi:hypothetical protein
MLYAIFCDLDIDRLHTAAAYPDAAALIHSEFHVLDEVKVFVHHGRDTDTASFFTSRPEQDHIAA